MHQNSEAKQPKETDEIKKKLEYPEAVATEPANRNGK